MKTEYAGITEERLNLWSDIQKLPDGGISKSKILLN